MQRRWTIMIGIGWVLSMLIGCNASTLRTSTVLPTQTTWQLVGINQRDVTANTVTLQMTPEELSGQGFCNQYRAAVTNLTEQTLSIGAVASTRKLCIDEQVMRDEREYFALLSQITTYQMTERGTLELRDTTGSAVLVFVAQNPE